MDAPPRGPAPRASSIVVKSPDMNVLNCLRNATWDAMPDMAPDYILNSHTCAIFSTISYHIMHPLIVQRKMKEIGRDFRVRICVVYVDLPDCEKPLLELNKACFSNDYTLILAWSYLEVARYFETFKCYESKPSTSIQEKVETGLVPSMTSVLTSIRSINKTDVSNLMTNFDNFKGICSADEHHIILCPGIGEKKVKRLHQILHQPLHQDRQVADGISVNTAFNPTTR